MLGPSPQTPVCAVQELSGAVGPGMGLGGDRGRQAVGPPSLTEAQSECPVTASIPEPQSPPKGWELS